MKKFIILLGITIIASFSSIAQIINGNFESWPTASWEALENANSSASESLRKLGTSNATKSTDQHGGSYAIRLETKVLGIDTSFGFFIFGDFGDSGPKAGVPYTQMPTALTGYYKCNLQSGDSALVIIVFFDNDTVMSMIMHTIGGTLSSFTQFTIPISLSSAPDSVLIAGTSSNPFAGGAVNGSWIIYDDLMFTGSGITQQVANSDFENWTTASVESPEGWITYNLDLYDFGLKHAEKTTDSYRGDYALKLNSYWVDNNKVQGMGNYEYTQNGQIGGWPFTTQTDTLIFYYKYLPQGNDSASFNYSLSKNGTGVGGNGMYLAPASSYTMASIPFSASMVPDTIRISFNSSRSSMDATNNGSALYIDELQLKSSPLNTAIKEYSKLFNTTSYPNPAKDFFNIDYTLAAPMEHVELTIYDMSGKSVFNKSYHRQSPGHYEVMIDISGFNAGVYMYKIRTDDQHSSGKMLVE